MSTNSNLQQINVFNKGMNTDTSDAYLSSEQYRYAENLRFITDTGENSGELRRIEGYKTLNGILNEQEKVIAVTSVRNLIIILSNDPYAQIRVHNVESPESDLFPYVDTVFKWSTNIKYSLVTRWESDNNIKLYIADGEHQLMCVNIASDTQCTKLEQLYDSAYLPPISVSKLDGGNIKSPKVQYYYYLYNPNTIYTDLSVGSKIQVLYKDGGNSGYYFNEYTNVGFELSIDDLGNLGYKRIRIYRVEYNQLGSPAQIYLICDENIVATNGLYKYEDRGSYLKQESVAEFLSNVKYRIAPKLIESKENVLFAANAKDLQKDVDDLFVNFNFNPDTDLELIEKKYSINMYGALTNNKSNYGPTLMRGETYRYGIVFYLKDGRKSSVFHLCDYTVPDTQLVGFPSDYDYEFTRLGLKFYIRNLPEQCIGYEIVRCERTTQDSRTLFQGLIGATFGRGGKDLRYASNLMSLMDMKKYGDAYDDQPTNDNQDDTVNTSFSDITTFASPEVVYQLDDVENVIKQYDGDLYIHHAEDYSIEEHRGVGNPAAVKNRFDQQVGVIRGNQFSVDYTNFEGQDESIDWTGGIKIYYRGLFLFPYGFKQNLFDTTKYAKILNAKGVYSPNPYNFNNGDNIIIDQDTTVIGNKQYVNWDAHAFFRTGEIDVADPQAPFPIKTNAFADISVKDVLKGVNHVPENVKINVSTGKKALLINAPELELYDNIETCAAINMVNIRRHNVVPYGGTSDSAKATNTYYSHGDYTEASSNHIDVWSGDTFASMFIYHSAHVYCSDRYYGLSIPTVYSVPVESRIDLQARYGTMYPDLYESIQDEHDNSITYHNSVGYFGGQYGDLITRFNNNRKAFLFQDEAGVYYTLTQDKDAYLYNTTYSDGDTAMSYTEKYLDDLTEPGTDTRVHHSQPKTNGELIDNWTKFKAMDFLDVDSRYGAITGLRLFKNSLVFWQKNATGVLAVNERTMLQDVNDTNIILGNGDVLQRYDYVSLKYGMTKDQLCDAQSDNILYWWDQDNKDLVMYPGGQSVQPMKIAKSVSNLLNKYTVEKPTLAYDNKYKEIIFSTINTPDGPKSLAYNEMIQQFTSLYGVDFQHKVELGDELLLVKDQDIDILQWNQNDGNLNDIRLKYIVNDKSTFTKVYDNLQIGMGDPFFGDDVIGNPINLKDADRQVVKDNTLKFTFNTTSQQSTCNAGITSREYDLRLAIPRDGNAKYGNRMRGRTMQCELTSSSTEFSLQYIITKYRISWS